MRLSLFQKGIIMVTGPLLVQIALVLSLLVLHMQAEADTKSAIRARDLSDATNQAVHKCYDMIKEGFIFMDQSTTGSGPAPLPMQTQDAFDTLDHLKKLAAGKPQDVAAVDTAIAAAHKMVDLCSNLTDIPPNTPARQRSLIRKEIFKKLRAYGHEFEALATLMQDNKRVFEEHPERQAAFRQRADVFVVTATICDIVWFFAVLWMFSRSIVGRLTVMMDNTHRLAADKPLNPPISGDDELAQVDRSFHSMAKSLTQAQRLRQEVVQMVSHDLRSPLTSVQGVLEMLERGMYGERKPEEQRMLQIAQTNAGRMITLINDLLDIDKLEAGKLRLTQSDVELEQIFGDALKSVVTTADTKKIKIETVSTDVSVFADGDRIVQILVNLLSNAIKFSPANSTITISAKPLDRFAEISVSDQGRGIPPEFISTIFDRFQQIKDSDAKESHGSGLGLAICKALVELHGGTIDVISEVGKGSTFRFRVPLSTAVTLSTRSAMEAGA